MTTQSDLEQPESYSSEDLTPESSNEALGAGSESPPSEPDAPQPGASDPRIEEAERALAEERGRQSDLQREIDDFRRRDETARFESDVRTEVQKRQDDLVGQNWGELEAKQESQSYGRAVIAERQNTDLQRQLEDAGKLVRAMQLEKETGVPAADLLPYNSPAEMERAAKTRSGESSRIKALEDTIKEMKQGAVPAGQTYDSNKGTGGRSDADIISAYADGQDIDIAIVQKAMANL